MKKALSLILAVSTVTMLLAGCSTTPAKSSTSTAPPASTSTSADPGKDTKIDYPTSTVEIVATANPGGANDSYARLYAQFLEEKWDVPVIVTNMATGGQAPAIRYVHDAKPDGYTVLNIHDAFFINEINQSIDFGIDDMTLLGITGNVSGQILYARKDKGWENLADFAAACEADPNKYTVAISYGSTTQVMGEMLLAAGVQAKIVDSDGGTDRLSKLLGGHVDTALLGWNTGADYVASGDWIPLCIFSAEREAVCPDVPTAVEQGFDAAFPSKFFLSMAPGVDAEIVQIWEDALTEINNDPAFTEAVWERLQETAEYVAPEEALPILKSSAENIKTYIK